MDLVEHDRPVAPGFRLTDNAMPIASRISSAHARKHAWSSTINTITAMSR